MIQNHYLDHVLNMTHGFVQKRRGTVNLINMKMASFFQQQYSDPFNQINSTARMG